MEKSRLLRHVTFWSVALLGAALDLASKHAAFARLGYPCKPVPVLGGFFVLRTARNTGTFFGLMSESSGANIALIVFTVLMSAMVLYMYLAPPREAARRTWLYTLALGLVFAGALGNLYDRVRFEAVRDFLDFGAGASRWPTFNLADTWLTTGIAVYLLVLFVLGRRPADAGEAPGSG